ncbi:acyltransferase family protein [Mycolicibacterium phlei]
MRPAGEEGQGGLEQVATVDRVPSLTGVRAVAALLVVATHAAYGTGTYTRGYVGLMFARMEIGVAIFFVLSGCLLFNAWVRAAADGAAPPSVRRYARSRARRILPAYLVTVLVVYAVYEFRAIDNNPGHTWTGLLRNLTLTQIYGADYLTDHVHQGLTQMWSLAVEVAFYAALPVLAVLLFDVLCRRHWRPGVLLAALAVLAAVSPLWLVVMHTTDWLPVGAGLWLPHYLVWFVGGMTLSVLAVKGFRCYTVAALPVAVVAYLIVSTPIAGRVTQPALDLGQDVAKVLLYGAIATLVVAPLVLGDRGLCERLLASRPMVWLGEISYEIFLLHVVVMEIVMVSVLRWPVYTGSVTVLFAVTVVVTTPVAWLLHRLTRPRFSAGWRRRSAG